jgi:hypothetical protein
MMTDQPLEDNEEREEEDDFFVTGTIIVQAGLSPEGELQWRWKYNDIEPALVLGFLEVMKDEVKDDIRGSVQEDDDIG